MRFTFFSIGLILAIVGSFWWWLQTDDRLKNVTADTPLLVHNIAGTVSVVEVHNEEIVFSLKTLSDNVTAFVSIPQPLPSSCGAGVSEMDVAVVVPGAVIEAEGLSSDGTDLTLCMHDATSLGIVSLPAIDASPKLEDEEEVRAALLKYLTERHPEATALAVRSLTQRDWPDGCLGLGEVDEACTEAIVPGYLAVVEVDGTESRYRTDTRGVLIRFEEPDPTLLE